MTGAFWALERPGTSSGGGGKEHSVYACVCVRERKKHLLADIKLCRVNLIHDSTASKNTLVSYFFNGIIHIFLFIYSLSYISIPVNRKLLDFLVLL